MIEITTLINNDFSPLDSHDTIETVQNFFEQASFSHFPVTEQNVYLGCIDAEDVETFESKKTIADYRYTLESFFVRENTLWIDVLEYFARNQTNIMPILSKDNTYIGYYEVIDVMKLFNETPFLKEQGGILIVEKETNEYSVSQIVQIVESNNNKVLGVFISDSNPEKTQITLKINSGNINEIIQTFRRFNYEIISEHQEDSYIQSLKDRSDYLDKYLNI